ncbi:MAG: hypothetical protein GY801_05100 [bacterium]|nr:hypothetical protein [bacterium]
MQQVKNELTKIFTDLFEEYVICNSHSTGGKKSARVASLQKDIDRNEEQNSSQPFCSPRVPVVKIARHSSLKPNYLKHEMNSDRCRGTKKIVLSSLNYGLFRGFPIRRNQREERNHENGKNLNTAFIQTDRSVGMYFYFIMEKR